MPPPITLPNHDTDMPKRTASFSFRPLLRLAFLLALAAAFWLALMPVPEMVRLLDWQDKIEHALLFAALALLGLAAWPAQPLRVAGGLLLYGVTMELAQSMTAYRYGDPLDWLADAVGVAAVTAFVLLRRRKRR
ncbi:VanZ family protein [Thauera phenolivorans]